MPMKKATFHSDTEIRISMKGRLEEGCYWFYALRKYALHITERRHATLPFPQESRYFDIVVIVGRVLSIRLNRLLLALG